jgi:hypothetical protein
VAHVETLARHIAGRLKHCALELSVDETALPTSAAEHFFIAHELRERGVRLDALAPRFVGDFEKGVDYKGDLKVFERSLREHAEIAAHLGGYKLSVHSGSDKFKIYPLVARLTGGAFHVKTAGTSYLEALRVAARKAPEFLREVALFCRGRYETDRQSYHVSATLRAVPPPARLDAKALERAYLDAAAGRQVLHVTFGSVLTATADGRSLFRARLLSLLRREADTYAQILKRHIGRHLSGLRARH